MLQRKNTKILSEINDFFTSSEKAVLKVIDIYRSLKLYKLNFGLQDFEQATYSKSDLLLCLLLFPIYSVKTVRGYLSSALKKYVDAGKNTFYRFKNQSNINWRSLLWATNKKLFKYSESNSNQSDNPKCLIVDDTDFAKTGFKIERIGKIWSHVLNKRILGFKGLFLGYWDGSIFCGLDFSLHREIGKNKKKPYGLNSKQRKKQYRKNRSNKSAGKKREKELNISKIRNMIKMIKRALKRKIKVDYILADSWFVCNELIKLAKSYSVELVGMFKMGKAKFLFQDKELTAKQISRILQKRKKVRWNKSLGLYCGSAIVSYKGTDLKLYFCKTTKRGKFHLLVSTDLKLDVYKAYKVYSLRWSVEVFFKEAKNYFAMGKCQSVDFDAQIADITISIINYNIFSMAKKFTCYETLGQIFSEMQNQITEYTLWQKIWVFILELLKTIAEIIDGDFNELVYRVLKSDKKENKIIKLIEINYSMAS